MTLKDFLKLATKRERAEVAVACHDSVSYLYQIAGNHRNASPLLATKIEQATRQVADASGGRLKPVSRVSMVRDPEIFMSVDVDLFGTETLVPLVVERSDTGDASRK